MHGRLVKAADLDLMCVRGWLARPSRDEFGFKVFAPT